MTEKDTQSENKVVDISFLKLRRRLWIMTAVSSFIGVSILILRVTVYPEVLNARVWLLMITGVLIFLRSDKACEDLEKELKEKELKEKELNNSK